MLVQMIVVLVCTAVWLLTMDQEDEFDTVEYMEAKTWNNHK